MDVIADEIRTNPKYGPDDDQIAFRQLQHIRVATLNRGMEWLNLFGVWRDRYRARQNAREIEQRERFADLCKQREALFAERAVAPAQHHAALTARLMEIGRELADLEPKFRRHRWVIGSERFSRGLLSRNSAR
jgi:hypothetical protein